MRLLRLALRCPHYKRTPRFRIEASERDAHASDDPARVLGTIQCHACNQVYAVTAAAYQAAA